MEKRIAKLESSFKDLHGSEKKNTTNTSQTAGSKQPDKSKTEKTKQSPSQQANPSRRKANDVIKKEKDKGKERPSSGNSSKTTSSSTSLSSRSDSTPRQAASKEGPSSAAPQSSASNEDMTYFQKAQLYLLSQLESNLQQGSQNCGANFPGIFSIFFSR